MAGWNIDDKTVNDLILDAVVPKAVKPSSTKPAKPMQSVANDLGPRMNTPLAHVDLGEHVIGSSHRHQLTPLANFANGQDMTVQMSIDGEGFDGMSEIPSVVRPMSAGFSADGLLAAPVGFRFSPTRRGAYRATIRISATWPDGMSAEETVQVVARARQLQDPIEEVRLADAKNHQDAEQERVRGTAYKAREDARIAENATHEEPYKQNAHDDLDNEKALADINIDALGRAQRRGIDFVFSEAPKFHEEHDDEAELWRKLAKLALQVGVAGFAAVFASALAPSVIAGIAGGTILTTEVGVEAATEALGGALEDGMKLGVDLAYEAGAEAAKKDVKAHDSKTQITAFFIAQQKTADALLTHNKKNLAARHRALLPLLRSNPRVPALAMKIVKHAFEITADRAEEPQKLATASKWADYVAQTASGSRGGATNVEGAHKHGMKGMQPNAAPLSGVLDLFVDVDGDSVVVRKARMFGVARKVTGVLVNSDLRTGAYPIRIFLHDGTGSMTEGAGVITRDESGVVRASGWSSLFGEREGGEVQIIARAEQIMSAACARSLAAWGVEEIEDNDTK